MADKKDTIEPIAASFDEVVRAVAPRASSIYEPEDESVIHDVEWVSYSC